jgi:L-threonylcarbamoyladenylate synthase
LIKKQEISRTLNRIRIVNPDDLETDFIIEAANVIRRGGIVAFPTRCLYGLGADAFNTETVKRIFEIKQRPHNKPLLVLIKDQNALSEIVRHVPTAASKIMKNFWPGRVTIVFEALDTLPENLIAGTGKIGVRLPAHKVASALVNIIHGPITGTSANLSGNTGYSRISEFDPLIMDNLDLALDAGPLKGGKGSTVVDVTGEFPEVLREGEISTKDIFAVLSDIVK